MINKRGNYMKFVAEETGHRKRKKKKARKKEKQSNPSMGNL